jgi:hypothetical protein
VEKGCEDPAGIAAVREKGDSGGVEGCSTEAMAAQSACCAKERGCKQEASRIITLWRHVSIEE